MMLTALARYDDPNVESVPFGYAGKPVGFTLVLRPGGSGCLLVAHYDDKGKAPVGLIPNLQRSGTKPVAFFACDGAAYVLGRVKAGDDAAKVAAKHALFVGLLREFSLRIDDSRAAAYLAWIAAGSPGLDDAIAGLAPHALKRLDMDPIGIALEGIPGSLHETRGGRAFWAEKARGGKAAGAQSLCLVCGQTKPTVATLPQSLIGHLIPGATQANVALASVNFPAASRGASGLGLRSAPVCADCAASAVQNLNALAASPKHSWRSPGGDVGMVWWATDSRADSWAAALHTADPALVADLLAAPATGASDVWRPDPRDRFFALTFSGNVSRFIVRRWIELPLAEMHRSVVRWFGDITSASSERPHFPIFRYAACLGPVRREQGKWVTPPPDGSVEALLLTAVADAPVPPHFLRLALARASAEIRLTTSDDGLTAGMARRRMEARGGLLRLILNRSVLKEDRMPSHLDKARRDPAYVSGRLFAVREALQRAALGEVNASILDKYFERASSNPASVAHVLEVLSAQHLKALRRKRGDNAYFGQQGLLTELNDLQGDAPGRLTPEGQAAWLCGFHQQRMHDIDSARAHKAARAVQAAARDTDDPSQAVETTDQKEQQ